jgi:flagellar protein FlaG
MNITTDPVNPTSPAILSSFSFGKLELKTGGDVASPERQREKISEDDVQKVVKELNHHLRATNTEMNFSVDKDTEKVVLKIVDSETQEVIRQIPAEEALRRSLQISKLLGFLVDENA